MELRNFQVVDTQTLSVTTSSSSGTFVTTDPEWKQANACAIANTGTAMALVVFKQGSAPTAVSSAPFGRSYVVPAGAVMVLNKDQADNFAAICPTGSTTLWLSAGFGN